MRAVIPNLAHMMRHSNGTKGPHCACLRLFRTSSGSVTVLDFPYISEGGPLVAGVVRCTNYTAHLGRWAVPVTRDDSVEYAVCGIDGCF